MAATTITFIELSGPGARDALASLGARAGRRGTPCELMASTTQPDLYLLVCRGDPGEEGAPPESRRWTFVPVEAYR